MRRRSLLREVLRSTPGKVGAALALFLGLASLLVVLTFPLDFGSSRWSNPSVWADNPKAVPPAWTAAFASETTAQHRVLEADEPTESTERGSGRVDG